MLKLQVIIDNYSFVQLEQMGMYIVVCRYQEERIGGLWKWVQGDDVVDAIL